MGPRLGFKDLDLCFASGCQGSRVFRRIRGPVVLGLRLDDRKRYNIVIRTCQYCSPIVVLSFVYYSNLAWGQNGALGSGSAFQCFVVLGLKGWKANHMAFRTFETGMHPDFSGEQGTEIPYLQ